MCAAGVNLKTFQNENDCFIVQGDPECTYIEDNVDMVVETGDHRRQMSIFCGQHTFCDRCSMYLFLGNKIKRSKWSD